MIERERFEEMGVRVALIDLDDTLVDTHKVYMERMHRAARIVVGEEGEEEFMDKWLARITKNRRKYSVNPKVLYESFDEVLGECAAEIRADAVEQIRCIWEEDIPEMFAGVKEFLTDLREAGLRICIVTHAGREWTDRKLLGNGLTGLVDGVYCIDINGSKDEDTWEDVYEAEGVTVNQVIVVGDSIVSDVWPNLNLGVVADRIIRVKSKFKFGSEDVPTGVVEVESLSQL